MTAILLGTVFVAADSMDNFSAAISIIQQKTPCSQLSQAQLIEVGDYYMQLQLGASHDEVDAMMGGDNATMDEQMHIALAERYYCNGIYPNQLNSSIYGGGMMGYGGDSGSYYGGMMGSYPGGYAHGAYGPGMMYAYGYRTPLMYYLPWILLVLVAGAGIAVTIVLVNKKKRGRSRRR